MGGGRGAPGDVVGGPPPDGGGEDGEEGEEEEAEDDDRGDEEALSVFHGAWGARRSYRAPGN